MKDWIEFVGLLEKVPSTIWAALIAAGIAGATSVLNNQNARRIVAMQLANANDQSEAKRRMDLKRDVFLPAIRAAAEIGGMAGMALDVNTPDETIQMGIKQFGADMAGVHVAASDKTLQAVVELSSAFGQLFFQLNGHRVALKVAKADVDLQQKFFDSRSAIGDSLLQRLRDQNLVGHTREERDRLNDQWVVHEKHMDEVLVAFNIASKKFQELNVQSLELLTRHLDALSNAQSKALFALRHDLELPIDEDEYLKLMRKSTQLAKSKLDESVTSLRAVVSPPA